MSAAFVPVWSPADFAATLQAVNEHTPDEVWSRFGYAVVEVPDGGGMYSTPWAPLAQRGRRYRGEHHRGLFRRRGLTVDDVRASL